MIVRRGDWREEQSLTVRDFDSMATSLSIKITNGHWMDRETPEGLSLELRDLAFAVVALESTVRAPKLRDIERLGDILASRIDDDVYYGGELVFEGLVLGGIGTALSPKDGLGDEQIAAFLRFIERIDQHLVNQPILGRNYGEADFVGSARTRDGTAHRPETLAIAIQMMGQVIGAMEQSKWTYCWRILIERADKYLLGDHPYLYVQTIAKLSKALSKLPLAEAYRLRRIMMNQATDLQPENIQRALKVVKPPPSRQVLEYAAAKVKTHRGARHG
jgi:hypothetical protein